MSMFAPNTCVRLEMDDIGRRILSNLNSAFQTDADIDEYDFLPIPKPEQNEDPLILTEHKLGLAAWAVPHLYLHVYKKLVAAKLSAAPACSDVLCWTRAVVLIQADAAVAWNWRKYLVTQGELDPSEDLKLCSLVLTRHPKSSETFIQRKWLVNYIIKQESGALDKSSSSEHGTHSSDAALLSQSAISCLQAELPVCSAAAEKYPNNYYAWCHRLWVLEHLGGAVDKVFLHAELRAAHAWVNRHVSDHSGLHCCQYLLQRLCPLEEPQEWRKLVEEELTQICDLILSYPGHEALWCHRRYIVTCQAVLETEASAQSTTDEDCPCGELSPGLLEQETQLIKRACADSHVEWQHALAKRHEHWLRNVLPNRRRPIQLVAGNSL